LLRTVSLSDELVAALEEDYRTAPVGEADRLMLEYVAQVTTDPVGITPDHHRRLRAAGFDELAVVQMTLIAGWFAYFNRVADALGVSRGRVEDLP
jgi:alkylhydroperoxidase family enzyme